MNRSVSPSIGPSVSWSVGLSVRRVVGALVCWSIALSVHWSVCDDWDENCENAHCALRIAHDVEVMNVYVYE